MLVLRVFVLALQHRHDDDGDEKDCNQLFFHQPAFLQSTFHEDRYVIINMLVVYVGFSKFIHPKKNNYKV